MTRNQDKATSIKKELLDMLKEEHAFWSYNSDSISLSDMDDDLLISLTMR